MKVIVTSVDGNTLTAQYEFDEDDVLLNTTLFAKLYCADKNKLEIDQVQRLLDKKDRKIEQLSKRVKDLENLIAKL